MILAEILKSQVENAVRQRGREYYYSGHVNIKKRDRKSLVAAVKGTRQYEVTLTREHGRIFAKCNCPYYKSGHSCKHIWATILEADSSQLLQPKATEKDIRLRLNTEPGSDEEDGSAIQHTPQPPAKPEVRRNAGSEEARKPSSWRLALSAVAQSTVSKHVDPWPASHEIVYRVSLDRIPHSEGQLPLSIFWRQRNSDGTLSTPKPVEMEVRQILTVPVQDDREILAILTGGNAYYDMKEDSTIDSEYVLSSALRAVLLPMLCRTGRFMLYETATGVDYPMQLDPGEPWQFKMAIQPDESTSENVVRGSLERGGEQRELRAPLAFIPGWVFWRDSASRLNDSNAFSWIGTLVRSPEIRIPMAESQEFATQLYSSPGLPPITMPDDLKYTELNIEPVPHLTVRNPRHSNERNWMIAQLRFDYGDESVETKQEELTIIRRDSKTIIRRNPSAEQTAVESLLLAGLRRAKYSTDWEFPSQRLVNIVSELIAKKWIVEAEGSLYRRPGTLKINVTTGIDWFEVHGTVDFEGVSVELPALLKAIKNNEKTIVLNDNTIAMISDEWLKQNGLITALGTVEGDHLKFQKHQAVLLDALLAEQPDATCDETFATVREEINSFARVEPVDPVGVFTGKLRAYQREGLAWLYFLQKYKFGGCLADDMGLGKTVQVLALLESRRFLRAGESAAGGNEYIGPSLVVAPRSLIFNWREEAGRFAPKLKILDHTGPTREKITPKFTDYDVILTTYGTLLRDIELLKEIQFDYAILDEAQAVKNSSAQTAKAARLVKSSHRLAMSGTPVQNHLGELWSLFEFLNPGMLGTASVFRLTEAASRNPSEKTRDLLARALRPFILRRTKAQVASDLPEKTEDTLHCELDKTQRKQYDELKNHYRLSLSEEIEKKGMNKSKIMIFEALLRLRQAACHPGLIDQKRLKESSAKLEALLPQLSEVIEEGHKALVFSQFTSFLSIVRKRLDDSKIRYEYLDGQTRDRQERVNNFQTDPDCRIFLISLKAGGLGLNLTAAEYVFLLDPWWNPAVEAQAIDRAHRIGQTQKVFAYRLIAKDTIEEKVLELQKTKKRLAESIINADNSLIRNMTRADLELLLA